MVVGAEARLGVVGVGNNPLFAVFAAVEAAPFVELVSADGQRVDVAIGPGLGGCSDTYSVKSPSWCTSDGAPVKHEDSCKEDQKG